MTFTILPLAPQAHTAVHDELGPSYSEADIDGNVEMDVDEAEPPFKRAKFSSSAVITPGETVTDDPQWMRWENQPAAASLNPSPSPSLTPNLSNPSPT